MGKVEFMAMDHFFNFHVFPSFVARAIMGDNGARCSLEEKDVQSYGRNQY